MLFTQKSHYSPTGDVAGDVNAPAQGLFLREAEHAGLSEHLVLVGSSWCQDFGTGCLRGELSEPRHGKPDLVLKEKGPCLGAAVRGKSPFSFSKALHTLSSEKRYTSVSRSQEAVAGRMQDMGTN